MDFTEEIADTENPLILKHEEVAHKRWSKKKSNHIDMINHGYPLAIQTVDVPTISSLKDHAKVPTKLILKKAILRVFVDNLKLPHEVRQRFIDLCGERYNPSTRTVKIVSDIKPSQHENVGNVYKLFRSLISEAWKADLNYIPSKDQFSPHQQIEIEMEGEEKLRQLEEQQNPKNFVRKDHVFFKVYEVPQSTYEVRPVHEILEDLQSI